MLVAWNGLAGKLWEAPGLFKAPHTRPATTHSAHVRMWLPLIRQPTNCAACAMLESVYFGLHILANLS